MSGRLRADGQQRERGRAGWRVGGGAGGHRNLHTGGVNGMSPGGKEGQGDLDYFKGECEVKHSWQGCSMGADGEEVEAVAAREEEEEGAAAWGKELWAMA